MNILFVALEESGKKISDKILKDLDNKNLKHNYYSFGLDQQATSNIKEVNEMKIKPIMGFFQVVVNFRYILNLRRYMISLVEKFNIDHIFFIDSFDYSRFFYKKFNKIKFSQIVGPSVFIWKNNRPEAQSGYNDDLVMAFAIGLFVRDSALKLRNEGLAMNKNALRLMGKTGAGGFSNSSHLTNDPWKMKMGNKGPDEDLTWLIK